MGENSTARMSFLLVKTSTCMYHYNPLQPRPLFEMEWSTSPPPKHSKITTALMTIKSIPHRYQSRQCVKSKMKQNKPIVWAFQIPQLFHPKQIASISSLEECSPFQFAIFFPPKEFEVNKLIADQINEYNKAYANYRLR